MADHTNSNNNNGTKDENNNNNNNSIKPFRLLNIVNFNTLIFDYPIFKNVEITIIMKKDFTPVEIHMNANYNIKYPILGKMNCNQEYVSKYEFNDDIK